MRVDFFLCFCIKNYIWTYTSQCVFSRGAVQGKAARFVMGDYRTTTSTSQIKLANTPATTRKRQTFEGVPHYVRPRT